MLLYYIFTELRAVVVAQLAERLLPYQRSAARIQSLAKLPNVLLTAGKTKIKETKRPGMALFKKWANPDLFYTFVLFNNNFTVKL